MPKMTAEEVRGAYNQLSEQDKGVVDAQVRISQHSANIEKNIHMDQADWKQWRRDLKLVAKHERQQMQGNFEAEFVAELKAGGGEKKLRAVSNKFNKLVDGNPFSFSANLNRLVARANEELTQEPQAKGESDD